MLYSVLGFLVLSFNVNAAEDEVEMAVSAQQATDNQSEQADARMLRQASPVAGYQALSVAGQQIDAAYLEQTVGVRHGAIVLFHDQGAQFESLGVITPLRHQLPDYGWSTLTVSLELSLPPNVMLSSTLDGVEAGETGANSDDEPVNGATNTLPPVPNSQRIEATLALLKAKGIERVLFLGHGQGGKIAIDMLASKTLPIAGLILVGVPDIERNDVFLALDIPILDVYGSQDLEGVAKAVKQRKATLKSSLASDYTIREIMGANHEYYGLEAMLQTTVRSWLNGAYVQRIFP